ncbi:hypothetical protein C4D60_Mb02t21870 [Musa balbisiana]|uniref:Uncharacterized protein n=1 Tax=Musa balbisiana TaxID=52838 RepID=A0A4S8ICG4_MUSBA|nr:hypothetical protein C4D60_Mb02t21870 [Musa balbisiana]
MCPSGGAISCLIRTCKHYEPQLLPWRRPKECSKKGTAGESCQGIKCGKRGCGVAVSKEFPRLFEWAMIPKPISQETSVHVMASVN